MYYFFHFKMLNALIQYQIFNIHTIENLASDISVYASGQRDGGLLGFESAQEHWPSCDR